MNLEEIREYCLSKKGTSEDTPFGPETLVFRVLGKLFGLISFEVTPNPSMNLKCEPNYAIELRENHEFIVSGYHMNKAHWNSIYYAKCPNNLLKSLIDHSYEQVILGFSKKEKETYNSIIS
jgi:predicted DNA-binding protein (MmcQ/YjbR family)